MKALIIILLVTAIAALQKTGYTQGGDFYVFDTCPDFDSSRYVQNLDLDFSTIPTSGKPCDVTMTGDIVQNFYISYVNMIAKFNGITIIQQKLSFEEYETKGERYSKTIPMPSEIMPSGTISGTGTAYNEFGDVVLCYIYQVYVRKNPTL